MRIFILHTTVSHPSTKATITLCRRFNGSGFYFWSPFINKLEAHFRFAGLQCTTDCVSSLKAPRGKIPCIQISTPNPKGKPRFLGHSTLIVTECVEKGLLEDLNDKLSPIEMAIDLAVRLLLEYKLYCTMFVALVSAHD